MSEKEYERPKCPRCGSASIVMRKDKSLFCRRCSKDTREDVSVD